MLKKLICILVVGIIPGCIELVPGPFFEVMVLPSDDADGIYRINLDGRVDVRFQVRMGENVRGEGFSVFVSGLPSDVIDLSTSSIGTLDPGETEMATVELLAIFGSPSQSTVTVSVTADITNVNDDSEVCGQRETATFTLIVVDPNAEQPPAEDGQPMQEDDQPMQGDMGTATCPEFVAHFNALPCATDMLTEAGSCSSGSEEDCTGFGEFNACRIQNSFCNDNNELVQNLDGCFALLDCG